ncbi:hypothetical protein Bca52824_080405 [Brassica carinata]|uniref:DUF4283 domain-containing protein n=1 Tax=Brassica carinata TaxID=52824 RepID=A0A8X7PIK7_BRACI|nr:hypothetical protein Bca52824_080405 [Brassica carinata]
MSRRLSRSEKGKMQAPQELPTKKPPVRIPANTNDDLIEANRLTIIGRLTNPLVQKPRAVIDFMAQVWNLEGRVVGRTLGLDKFQIKFETEQELTQVLEKGPYHYKRWMLILQRWEPTVSDQFPSNISFNVRIHGIPLHFWSEQTIRTIGKELGNYSLRDEKDAKIWVEVNGLQPLIMKMEIELPTDDITEVEFEYMKIEKHCFTCFSLLHEEIDCPYRPLNAPPPKERKLGITQSIALQRIEAEKKRHDDRRGYSRPENANLSLRSADDSYIQPRREVNRSEYGRYKDRTGSYIREHSILSRTARSNAAHYRNQRPSMQYRVVDKSRLSSGSSTPHQVSGGRSGVLAVRTSPPNNIGRDLPLVYKGVTSFVSFIYGAPAAENRAAFWSKISSVGTGRDDPWLITGDFNDILTNAEKCGGPTRPESSFTSFRTFVAQNGLWDLKHTGEQLSWRGNRHTHFIRSRLDRSMGNCAWAEAFPMGRCRYLRFEGSDHRPLMSYFNSDRTRKRGMFRFNRALTEQEEVTQLVDDAWNSSPLDTVIEKLNNCRRSIIRWAKEQQKQSNLSIKRNQELLEAALSSDSPDATIIEGLNMLKGEWSMRSQT